MTDVMTDGAHIMRALEPFIWADDARASNSLPDLRKGGNCKTRARRLLKPFIKLKKAGIRIGGVIALRAGTVSRMCLLKASSTVKARVLTPDPLAPVKDEIGSLTWAQARRAYVMNWIKHSNCSNGTWVLNLVRSELTLVWSDLYFIRRVPRFNSRRERDRDARDSQFWH